MLDASANTAHKYLHGWLNRAFRIELRGVASMVKRADLEPQIISEWLKRPVQNRKERDILLFYGELSQNKPHLLLFQASGDKYQHLKTILRHHVEN